MRLLAACAGLALLAVPAWAEGERFRAGVEVGGAWRSGDTFAEALPFAEYGERNFAVGLGAPIRVRMLDGKPTDQCATPGLRCQDWDKPGDWLRILRHFDLGSPETKGQIHVGDLTGLTLGHGSLVWRYYNNQLLDVWHTGAYAVFDNKSGGVSALVGDLLRMDLLALRAHGRPFRGGLRRLEFGLGVAAERREQVWQADGTHVRALTSDFQGSLSAPFAPSLVADLGYEIVAGNSGQLLTWLDAVWQVDRGVGAHLGMRAVVRGRSDSLAATLEGRYAGRGYLPAAIGPLYELQWPLRSQAALPAGWGSRASAEWVHRGLGRVLVALDHQQGQKLDTYLWYSSEPLGSWSLRAWAVKRWLRGEQGSGNLDLGQDPIDWSAYVSARLRVDGPWYAALAAGRRWRVHGTWPIGQSPLYAENEVRLAAGAEWRW
ncbi:MAG: hypothetical protein HY902_01015 [Deltaproteobacteria bacterium]|nr:hypothetical protein [Deltaproteobacteria bacterium]